MDLDEKKEDSGKADKTNEDEAPGKHRDTERDLKDDFLTNVHIFKRELGIENLDEQARNLGRCDSYLRNLKLSLTDSLTH